MNPIPHTPDMPHWLEDTWMDRYLERRLTDEESAWFEAYLLTRPRLVARLEADNDLRDAMQSASGAAAAAPAPARGTVGSDHDGIDRSITSAPAPRRMIAMSGFALAASVAIAALIGALTATRFGTGADTGATAATLAIASPPRVVFDTMRGAASDAVLHAGNPASRYVLIEVSLPASVSSAQFVGADGKTLPVSPGVDGFASVLVPSAGLVGTAAPRLRYSVDGREVERVLEADYAGLLAPR
jgi:hypothetical protein